MVSSNSNLEARREHRYRHRARLSVSCEGRVQPLAAVTANISRGGFFIELEEEVAPGEALGIRLLDIPLETPLLARVVHSFRGERKGLGVRLDELPTAAEGYFEAFLHGVEATSPIDGDPARRRASAGMASRAREFLDHYDEGRFYQAVGQPLDATVSVLRVALESLQVEFDAPGDDAGLPRARRALTKVRRTLLDPEHRLAHDLKHGHREVADLVNAPPLEERSMRKAWALAFPARTMQAKELSDAAQIAIREGGVAKACRLGEQALVLDPFNQRLRTAVGHWKRRVS